MRGWITWKTKNIQVHEWKIYMERELKFVSRLLFCNGISKFLLLVCLLLVNLIMKTRILHGSVLLVMPVNLYGIGVWKHLRTALPKTLLLWFLPLGGRRRLSKLYLGVTSLVILNQIHSFLLFLPLEKKAVSIKLMLDYFDFLGHLNQKKYCIMLCSDICNNSFSTVVFL